MEGFDSHYALVRRVHGLIYVPAKPGEIPDYDELVVFRPAQILPRYIYYYRTVEREKDAQQLLVTLWIDPNPAPNIVCCRRLHLAIIVILHTIN